MIGRTNSRLLQIGRGYFDFDVVGGDEEFGQAHLELLGQASLICVKRIPRNAFTVLHLDLEPRNVHIFVCHGLNMFVPSVIFIRTDGTKHTANL